jgi:putative transposase
MFTIISSLFFVLRRGLQTRVALHAEILALRHQLLVLQRSNRGHRPRLSLVDRIVWVWLSGLWCGWQSALVMVRPETVIAWHWQGF